MDSDPTPQTAAPAWAKYVIESLMVGDVVDIIEYTDYFERRYLNVLDTQGPWAAKRFAIKECAYWTLARLSGFLWPSPF